MRRFQCWMAVFVGSLIFVVSSPTMRAADDATAKKYEQMVDKAVAFLATKAQADDGSFNAAAGPAVTALVTTAILRQGRSPEDPVVAKSMKYVERFVQADGGIYAEGTVNKNYETCIAILCFKEANRNGKYDALLKKADAYVKASQWGPTSEHRAEPHDVTYGGTGYGRTGDRPDLSNTSFFLDALKATGNAADSEAIQQALMFVSRCQNLEGPNNTTPFAAKLNDGGFYYTPAAGGNSQAGNDETTGGLRSYASMTYAGLKSMIYAGLQPDDERVKAAIGWLKKHYDLESNPGLGNQGLYYYYMTFSKALSALGQDSFVDEQGASHDW
ncbi:MAG TPA: prenyltransferase/squalene oxidase repeat-containing protein, partial [Pirellulaceae bacterium]|nr:prenyltransferase/squalene oxidase repeat-containing protein [Pirellulaceae bacterium]